MENSGEKNPCPKRAAHQWGGWGKNVVGVAISIVCMGFVAWRIEFKDVSTAIMSFQWSWLPLGLGSLALGYGLRIVRWATLLRAAGANVTPSKCAGPFLASIALNNTLPMRLGDVVRALVFPGAIGISRTVATGSLIMERLVDLMTLLASLAIGLAVTSRTQLPEWLIGMSVALSIAGSIFLIMVFLLSGWLSCWVDRWASKAIGAKRKTLLLLVRGLLEGFDAMSRLPVLLSLFALSMLVWAGEAGLFWSLLHGLDLEADAGSAVVVMAIATLSTLVPSSPGYVGPFHLAAFSAVTMLDGGPTQAASFAVLAHLGVWLPTTVVGALAMLLSPQLFGRAKAMAAAQS